MSVVSHWLTTWFVVCTAVFLTTCSTSDFFKLVPTASLEAVNFNLANWANSSFVKASAALNEPQLEDSTVPAAYGPRKSNPTVAVAPKTSPKLLI